jgi:hypothetical protein
MATGCLELRQAKQCEMPFKSRFPASYRSPPASQSYTQSDNLHPIEGLGVSERRNSVRHDSKPEGSRLTTNAITGLKPRRTRYAVTDPGSAGVRLRVMPGGAK